MKLKNQVALVTGAGRGIGRATALLLAREGARVVVNDLDPEASQEVAHAIESEGGRVLVCDGSATDPDFSARFIKTALDGFGGLDILVNNAGYAWDGVIHKMTDEQFDAMLDIHLKAPFRILRAASDYLRETAKKEQVAGQRAHRKVVNVSSIAAVHGNAGQVNYAAGKAGVIGMTRSLAREWGRFNVNVNAVAFGYVVTRMTQAVDQGGATVRVGTRDVPAGVPASQLKALEASIPLGRCASVGEAAGAIALLCYPESNYITGHVLMATGGL